MKEMERLPPAQPGENEDELLQAVVGTGGGGAAQHRSSVVREYLDITQGAVQTALQPGYSPYLNPVKYLWA